MKYIVKTLDTILYTIAAILIIAAISSAIWHKPMILSAVRSNSMYPLLQRGDMIIIKSLTKADSVSIGDIVVFRSEEGSLASEGFIVHRITEGDDLVGYITKGDANEFSDQEFGEAPPIQRDWMVSKVITIGNTPLKIPLIGYVPLWMEKFQNNPFAFPIIAIILAVILGAGEFSRKKKKKKKSGLELQIIYFCSGLTISVIMAATMLASSQRITIPYEVSATNTGVIGGSNIGVVKVGEEISRPITDVKNNGFFPVIYTITSKDPQLTFSHTLFMAKPGKNSQIYLTLHPEEVGNYTAIIYSSMFYPFLPSTFIYFLASKNYWIALATVSLIPGLPLMVYPLLDSTMRRKTKKVIRRIIRRIQRKLVFLSNIY